MDRYYRCFAEAIEGVWTTMLQTQVSVGEPTVIESGSERCDVSATIGFLGPISGVAILGLPRGTAEQTVSKFVCTQMGVDHADFPDAVGELVNMIAGSAKGKFKLDDCKITCPTVVVNDDHKVFTPRGSDTVILKCDTQLGPFIVEVSIRETIDEQEAAA